MEKKNRIMNAIIEALDTTREALTEENRTAEIAEKRNIFYFFSADYGVNYQAIGDYINRSHSSSWSQAHKIRDRASVDKAYASEIKELRNQIINLLNQ